MNTENPAPLPYPFGWPTGKPSRTERKPKKKWRRKSKGLTKLTNRPHNALVLDVSKTGRGNPIQLRRTSAKSGRFFFARNPIMAAWLGHGSSMARTLTRVFHPLPSRHPITVESDRGGSIQSLRSHLMKSPTQATPETRPNFNKTTSKASTGLGSVRDCQQGGPSNANG